jgi:hypothetical protein
VKNEREGFLSEEEFWDVVGEPAVDTEQAEQITQRLVERGLDVAYSWDDMLSAHLAELERWDLFTIAWIIGSAASDDTFLYFRLWVVSRGRSLFELARNDAEAFGLSLDPLQNPRERRSELLMYAAENAASRLGVTATRRIANPRQPGPRGDEPGDYWAAFPAVTARFAKANSHRRAPSSQQRS